MSEHLTRRGWMSVSALAACTLATRRVESALRVPSGGVLRLPSPAARRVHDPARAVEFVDVWPLALMHESIATIAPDGTATWPLLAFPPLVDRGDPRVVTLTLRPSMTFANGAPITATAVVEAWQGARQGALGRLALARFATMSPFEARGERDVVVRLALAQTLAAVMPLPEGMSELTFAGALAGHRIPMIRRPNGSSLYADADFCIQGIIHPGQTKREGPFGDHLGFTAANMPGMIFAVIVGKLVGGVTALGVAMLIAPKSTATSGAV